MGGFSLITEATGKYGIPKPKRRWRRDLSKTDPGGKTLKYGEESRGETNLHKSKGKEKKERLYSQENAYKRGLI